MAWFKEGGGAPIGGMTGIIMGGIGGIISGIGGIGIITWLNAMGIMGLNFGGGSIGTIAGGITRMECINGSMVGWVCVSRWRSLTYRAISIGQKK